MFLVISDRKQSWLVEVEEGFITIYRLAWASQVALVVKNLPANAGDVKDSGLIPGLGKPLGGRHGNPL